GVQLTGTNRPCGLTTLHSYLRSMRRDAHRSRLRSRISGFGWPAPDGRRYDSIPGGVAGGATPVPIPNTEVKPSWADGTAWATAWESRSLPGLITTGGTSRSPRFPLDGEAMLLHTSARVEFHRSGRSCFYAPRADRPCANSEVGVGR